MSTSMLLRVPSTPDVTAPTYDEQYYASYGGVNYAESTEFAALFHHFADRVVATLNPTKTLDAGCAIGRFVEALRARGVEAYGFDVSDYAIGQADPSIGEYVWVGSLTEALPDTYDLITCIEVIEHLPAAEAPVAVANLCAATDRILLSSTPYEYEEPTHLNVQPPEYWSALFAAEGFFRVVDFDATFISPWAVLYERRPAQWADRVRDYDRSFWRLRDENVRLRNALLEATSNGGSGDPDITRADVLEWRERAQEADALGRRVDELESQLREAQHVRLRAVDASVAAERKAGTALGRVRELESEIARLQSLEHRYNEVINSTTWQLTWKALTPYRELRHRSGR